MTTRLAGLTPIVGKASDKSSLAAASRSNESEREVVVLVAFETDLLHLGSKGTFWFMKVSMSKSLAISISIDSDAACRTSMKNCASAIIIWKYSGV
jgi:hypothetical protein